MAINVIEMGPDTHGRRRALHEVDIGDMAEYGPAVDAIADRRFDHETTIDELAHGGQDRIAALKERKQQLLRELGELANSDH